MKGRIIDWGERTLITVLFLYFATSNISSGDWTNFILVYLEAVVVVFILTRRQAKTVSESPIDLGIALAGTTAPLLFRPGGEALAGWLGTALVAAGTALSFVAKASLNRRFGVAPANRGVQARFAYRIVRHPMYLGYIIAQAGYVLHNPTGPNCVVYAACCCLLAARSRLEERHLLQDSEYKAYAEKVRYRFLPGLF